MNLKKGKSKYHIRGDSLFFHISKESSTVSHFYRSDYGYREATHLNEKSLSSELQTGWKSSLKIT